MLFASSPVRAREEMSLSPYLSLYLISLFVSLSLSFSHSISSSLGTILFDRRKLSSLSSTTPSHSECSPERGGELVHLLEDESESTREKFAWYSVCYRSGMASRGFSLLSMYLYLFLCTRVPLSQVLFLPSDTFCRCAPFWPTSV
jgi:hypothetical protein